MRRLYAVKGRPADHPVIVHLARAAQLDDLGARRARRRARARRTRSGPGRSRSSCARDPSASSPRGRPAGATPSASACPTIPLALALLDAFGGGVAAPSANRFGRVSPTTAAARARRSRRRRRRRARRRPVPRRRRVDDRRRDRRRAGRSCASAASSAAAIEAVVGARASRCARAARSRRRARSRRTTRRGDVEIVELGAVAHARRDSRDGRASACSRSHADRAPDRLVVLDAPRRRRASTPACSTRGCARPTTRGLDVLLVVLPPDRRRPRRRGRRPLARAPRPRAPRATVRRGRWAATTAARSACSTAGSAGSPSCGRCSTSFPASDVVYFGDTGRFPVRTEARRRGVEVLARDRRPAARARREDDRRRVQQRVGRRARPSARARSTFRSSA